jgi:hypothetical protein
MTANAGGAATQWSLTIYGLIRRQEIFGMSEDRLCA